MHMACIHSTTQDLLSRQELIFKLNFTCSCVACCRLYCYTSNTCCVLYTAWRIFLLQLKRQ